MNGNNIDIKIIDFDITKPKAVFGAPKFKKINYKKRLSDTSFKAIYQAFLYGFKPSSIAKSIMIPEKYVYKILCGKVRKDLWLNYSEKIIAKASRKKEFISNEFFTEYIKLIKPLWIKGKNRDFVCKEMRLCDRVVKLIFKKLKDKYPDKAKKRISIAAKSKKMVK